MRFVKHFFMLQVILLLFLLLGCGSEGGKDTKSVLDSDKESSAPVAFSGKWNLLENKNDCKGESSTRTEVVIVQNADKATLAYDSATEPVECAVMQTELHCDGTMAVENGERLEIEDATFWYDENNNLQGESEWTRFDSSDIGCDGTSEFSLFAAGTTDIGTETHEETVPSFDGSWSIRETVDEISSRCESIIRTGTYTCEVDQTGTTATFSTISRQGVPILAQCSVVHDELRCSGEYRDADGYLHLYEEYNLRFVGDERLNGNTVWGIYDSDNHHLCSGTSRLTGVRVESADSTQQQP